MKDCGPAMPPAFVKEEAREGNHPSMKRLEKKMDRKASKRGAGRKSSR